MSLAYANEEEKKKGWTLSCSFLNQIKKSVEENQLGDDTPSLEQIEDVILTYEKLK